MQCCVLSQTQTETGAVQALDPLRQPLQLALHRLPVSPSPCSLLTHPIITPSLPLLTPHSTHHHTLTSPAHSSLHSSSHPHFPCSLLTHPIITPSLPLLTPHTTHHHTLTSSTSQVQGVVYEGTQETARISSRHGVSKICPLPPSLFIHFTHLPYLLYPSPQPASGSVQTEVLCHGRAVQR